MIVDAPRALEQKARPAKKRLLIVDDDKAVRESLKKVLDEAGYEVATAADGDEGEKQFVANAPELVLLDLELPKQDGWDVLGIVSAQAPLIPVIVITGLRAQLDTTLIPGISALFEKPIDVSLLLRTVERLLTEPPEQRLTRLAGHLVREKSCRSARGRRWL